MYNIRNTRILIVVVVCYNKLTLLNDIILLVFTFLYFILNQIERNEIRKNNCIGVFVIFYISLWVTWYIQCTSLESICNIEPVLQYLPKRKETGKSS